MFFVDAFLNSITMYRLVLYGLAGLSGLAVVFGFLGILPYGGGQMLLSLLILTTVSWAGNAGAARLAKAPTNQESSVITALILFFIFAPPSSGRDAAVLALAALLSVAAKYLFAVKRKHLFNPAAAAAVVLGFAGSPAAVWWVGSDVLLPVVAVVGLLIVRKIRRFPLFFSFLAASAIVMLGFGMANGVPAALLMRQWIVSWPVVFFATVMLTEPLTMPPTRRLQMMYGTLVGAVFSSQFHVGPVYPTPELALVIGNLFAYMVSPKQKLMLQLDAKTKLAPHIYDFSFRTDERFSFLPGQYVEWTLPHRHIDSRGNRRYFTLASSPTEPVVRLGIRYSPEGSSFKRALMNMEAGQRVAISQLAGEFTLPKDPSRKLVFVAGGIGITPFRSMVKYLVDTRQRRDIILFYACQSPADFVYTDVFDAAKEAIGLTVIYVVADSTQAPPGWQGKTGYITEAMVREAAPDFLERTFYLSGPNAMVEAYLKLLRAAGVPRRRMVTDYFPGF